MKQINAYNIIKLHKAVKRVLDALNEDLDHADRMVLHLIMSYWLSKTTNNDDEQCEIMRVLDRAYWDSEDKTITPILDELRKLGYEIVEHTNNNMKAVLMAFDPIDCNLIFNGEKPIDARKVAPNLKPPYKVYVYENLGKQTSCRKCAIWRDCDLRSPFGCWEGAGAVVGEFVCDTLITDKTCGKDALFNGAACLTKEEAEKYSGGKVLRGLHITEPKRYDTPKELSEFTPWCEKPFLSYDALKACCDCPKAVFDEDGAFYGCRVTRAPRSWCYVHEVQNG